MSSMIIGTEGNSMETDSDIIIPDKKGEKVTSNYGAIPMVIRKEKKIFSLNSCQLIENNPKNQLCAVFVNNPTLQTKTNVKNKEENSSSKDIEGFLNSYTVFVMKKNEEYEKLDKPIQIREPLKRGQIKELILKQLQRGTVGNEHCYSKKYITSKQSNTTQHHPLNNPTTISNFSPYKPESKMEVTNEKLTHSTTVKREENKNKQRPVKFNLQNFGVINEADLSSITGAKLEPKFTEYSNSNRPLPKINIDDVSKFKLNKHENTNFKTVGHETLKKKQGINRRASTTNSGFNIKKPEKQKLATSSKLFRCKYCSFQAKQQNYLSLHCFRKHNQKVKKKKNELQKDFCYGPKEVCLVSGNITDNVLHKKVNKKQNGLQTELHCNPKEVQLLPMKIVDKELNLLEKRNELVKQFFRDLKYQSIPRKDITSKVLHIKGIERQNEPQTKLCVDSKKLIQLSPRNLADEVVLFDSSETFDSHDTHISIKNPDSVIDVDKSQNKGLWYNSDECKDINIEENEILNDGKFSNNISNLTNLNAKQDSLNKIRINNLIDVIHILKNTVRKEGKQNKNELLEIFDESEEMLLDMLLIRERNIRTDFILHKNMPYSNFGLEKIESYINNFARSLLTKKVIIYNLMQ